MSQKLRIKARDIRVGDRLVVPWDEPAKLVTRTQLGRPGRGIKGRGINVYYDDKTGSLLPECSEVEVFR